MRPALEQAGYDVCVVDLPDYSLGDIQISAEYVVYAIDQMYAADGGRKIGVVGHSQGNMEIRWALKWWTDLQNKVDDAVMLGNPGHGTAGGNLFCILPCDVEIRTSTSADLPAAEVQGVLARTARQCLDADPRCRRVVYAAPAGDSTALGAATAAGFRYVVDVDLPDVSLSLLVAEPGWVTAIDLDRVPGT